MKGLIFVTVLAVVVTLGGTAYVDRSINELTQHSLKYMTEVNPFEHLQTSVEAPESPQSITEPQDIQPAGGYKLVEPTEQVQVAPTNEPELKSVTIQPMTREQWLQANRPPTPSTSQETTIEFTAQ